MLILWLILAAAYTIMVVPSSYVKVGRPDFPLP